MEEYFSYNIDEYYESLQMGLPALYYSGRNNPPHPEIWINYFLRMVLLYSKKVCEIANSANDDEISAGLSYLKRREKELLVYLIKSKKSVFSPIEISRETGVTNKTVINRLSVLAKNGFVVPNLVSQRVRTYELSEFTKENSQRIQKQLSDY